MSLERIELRFSPGNANERVLIEAMNELGDEYGAKGRYLKERLLKGYMVVLNEIDQLMLDKDPLAALDRYSLKVDARHYRVLKVLLTNRLASQDVSNALLTTAPSHAALGIFEAASDGPAVSIRSKAEVESVSHDSMPVAPPSEMAVLTAVNAAAAQVLAQPPVFAEVADEATERAETPDVPAEQALPVEPTPAPVPKFNWSALAGIAGSKKGV